ncbi:hypothetical protein [Luteimonas saliphila]|uniref:hypothetical protein n=1 Tax=Luteimonas saliphila TaxID=2804919 RepID=UPI00192E0C1C|nr:hypothetical protein [Luteimonas saliphila]
MTRQTQAGSVLRAIVRRFRRDMKHAAESVQPDPPSLAETLVMLDAMNAQAQAMLRQVAPRSPYARTRLGDVE